MIDTDDCPCIAYAVSIRLADNPKQSRERWAKTRNRIIDAVNATPGMQVNREHPMIEVVIAAPTQEQAQAAIDRVLAGLRS